MAKLFKVGDVVRKDGRALKMTVSGYDAATGEVICWWKDKGETRHEGRFAEGTLEEVKVVNIASF